MINIRVLMKYVYFGDCIFKIHYFESPACRSSESHIPVLGAIIPWTQGGEGLECLPFVAENKGIPFATSISSQAQRALSLLRERARSSNQEVSRGSLLLPTCCWAKVNPPSFQRSYSKQRKMGGGGNPMTSDLSTALASMLKANSYFAIWPWT